MKVLSTFTPVAVVPSPKSQLYAAIPESSVELEPLKFTSNGALPFVGTAIILAKGGVFPPFFERLTTLMLS